MRGLLLAFLLLSVTGCYRATRNAEQLERQTELNKAAPLPPAAQVAGKRVRPHVIDLRSAMIPVPDMAERIRKTFETRLADQGALIAEDGKVIRVSIMEAIPRYHDGATSACVELRGGVGEDNPTFLPDPIAVRKCAQLDQISANPDPGRGALDLLVYALDDREREQMALLALATQRAVDEFVLKVGPRLK